MFLSSNERFLTTQTRKLGFETKIEQISFICLVYSLSS